MFSYSYKLTCSFNFVERALALVFLCLKYNITNTQPSYMGRRIIRASRSLGSLMGAISLTLNPSSHNPYSSPGITPQSVNRQGPLGLLWVPKGTDVARFVPASVWKLAYTHNERRQSSLKATQCCGSALPPKTGAQSGAL